MQDAADAALNFARQGFSAAEAADMIAPAMDLAAGTATDLSVITGGVGKCIEDFLRSRVECNGCVEYACESSGTGEYNGSGPV